MVVIYCYFGKKVTDYLEINLHNSSYANGSYLLLLWKKKLQTIWKFICIIPLTLK